MKKAAKFIFWAFLFLVVLLIIASGLFMYKIKNGFPVSYETEAPEINFLLNRRTVLLFSKSTGFVHSESIEAGKKVIAELASKNNWFLYSTDKAGIFNTAQLKKFDVVIFNNSTGRLLNAEQEKAFEAYITNGGHFIGVHGAGDNSHHWDWYTENLIGADFSHHSMDFDYPETEIKLNGGQDSLLAKDLPAVWPHGDEWYVFFENPKANGFRILYSIDGEEIPHNGNILFIRDKNFGMGKDHPVAWYRNLAVGWTFYTSLGHGASAWKQPAFVKMIENAVLH